MPLPLTLSCMKTPCAALAVTMEGIKSEGALNNHHNWEEEAGSVKDDLAGLSKIWPTFSKYLGHIVLGTKNKSTLHNLMKIQQRGLGAHHGKTSTWPGSVLL